MPRAQFTVRQQRRTLAALRAYIDAGHALHFETVHGDNPEDSRIIFHVEDWEAFVEMLEPGVQRPSA